MNNGNWNTKWTGAIKHHQLYTLDPWDPSGIPGSCSTPEKQDSRNYLGLSTGISIFCMNEWMNEWKSSQDTFLFNMKGYGKWWAYGKEVSIKEVFQVEKKLIREGYFSICI